MTADPPSLPAPSSRSLAAWPGRARRWLADLLLAPVYRLYTNRLRHEIQSSTVPTHVAVILDGNRRWASVTGLQEPARAARARPSGFLLWQGAHSELYFTDVYWPAFREVDFLRGLRSYQQRHRRFGR